MNTKFSLTNSQTNNNYDDILKLIQQEKYERSNKNTLKTLECCTKIVFLL